MRPQAPVQPLARLRISVGLWFVGLLFTMTPLLSAREARWTSFAQPAHFEHLSVEHGLSQSVVHQITQDHRGFLWFATDSGLNRYDGYNFLVFRNDKQSPQTSIGGDRINCLLEDSRKILWIGTNHGLSRLDPETLDIQTFYASGTPGALPSNSILNLAEDPSGNLWLGTEAFGLACLPHDWNPATPPRFRNLGTPDRGPQSPPTGRITALHVDRKGTLWFCSVDTGLGRLKDFSKPAFEYFPVKGSPGIVRPANQFCIQDDDQGGLWIGSETGLFHMDPESNQWRRYTHNPSDPGSMPNNVVYTINRDRMGSLWLANDGAGLSRMLPRQHPTDPPRFQRFQHDPSNPQSISSNGIQCAFEDRSGVLWVSAYQTGLNKLVLNTTHQEDRTRPIVFQHSNRPADPNSLSGNHVATICRDRYGNLWAGTDGFGANRARFEPGGGKPLCFERFAAKIGQAGALQDEVIVSSCLDRKQRLWLGTYKAGLVRVDQESPSGKPRFTHFRAVPSDPTAISSDFIHDIMDAGNGKIWLATGNNGLNLFDPSTARVQRFPLGKGGRPWMRDSPEIDRLAQDAFGTIWMATPDGLNRLNPATGECRGYVAQGPGTLSDANVLTIHVDRNGNLWVGTGGGGLNKTVIPAWDGPEPRFVHYGHAEGLPSIEIKNILEDAKGQLWLSTNRQLCRFDPQLGRAFPFPWQNDLRKGEFIKNSSCILPSGELLFGSNNGFCIFHPDDITFDPVAPPIVLTGFQTLNQGVPLKHRLRWKPDGTPEITVQPWESSFTVSFAALHYVAPDQNRYMYQMEGLESDWNEGGNQHAISFARVPPGNYVLRVRGSNCDELWSDKELRLAIRVLPAWYNTLWFRTILLVSAIAVLLAGIWLYFASLKRRNRFLEDTMQEQARRLHEIEALDAMAHLSETSGSAGDDLHQWVDQMIQEVCRAVDADRIDIWEVTETSLRPVTETQELPSISCAELALIKDTDPSQEYLPILGPDGDIHATLRVHGKVSPWTTIERQLITSFINHLGGAYHLQWLRQTLAENRTRRSLDRQTLLAQGSGILQLCPTCKRCFDENNTVCPDDSTPLVSPGLLPFRFQGRYRLVRLLGEGGSAHVFEAWDDKLAREVALKTVKPHNFVIDQTRERFTQEARILARLDHPGIVSIHDTGELEDGTVFIVMERLRGRTVGYLIRAYGASRPSQAAFLLRQVASALASTHTKGLIHRDLKPDNLFAAVEGDWLRYKVLDFGLAKPQVTDMGLTQSGALMGTPNYMSPEQIRGHVLDWHSDLYSLAAILYEVLSGQSVVTSSTLADVFVEVLSREPAPISTWIPDCPAEVELLLAQGLAKEPGQRATDLLAWAGRLDDALQGWNRSIPGWPDLSTQNLSLDSDGSEPTIHPEAGIQLPGPVKQ